MARHKYLRHKTADGWFPAGLMQNTLDRGLGYRQSLDLRLVSTSGWMTFTSWIDHAVSTTGEPDDWHPVWGHSLQASASSGGSMTPPEDRIGPVKAGDRLTASRIPRLDLVYTPEMSSGFVGADSHPRHVTTSADHPLSSTGRTMTFFVQEYGQRDTQSDLEDTSETRRDRIGYPTLPLPVVESTRGRLFADIQFNEVWAERGTNRSGGLVSELWALGYSAPAAVPGYTLRGPGDFRIQHVSWSYYPWVTVADLGVVVD